MVLWLSVCALVWAHALAKEADHATNKDFTSSIAATIQGRNTLGSEGCERGGKGPHAHERIAFVTVVSGDHYVLAARVLRRSLLVAPSADDNPDSDLPGPAARICMLMLHTIDFSPSMRNMLLEEGWRLQHVERLANPFDDEGLKQRQVFTKLSIWNLEGIFDRIVFFDADMVARKDASTFFGCAQAFCAAPTTRETGGRFNSGLMVLSPNRTLFQEMLQASRSSRFHSYNKGDQGFLNAFLPSWCQGEDTGKPWADVISLPPGNKRCGLLHSAQEVAAVAAKTDTVLLHYNHPLWWCLKPWSWPAYPLHYIHWEWHWHRRGLPDEAAAAGREILAAMLLPLLLLPLCARILHQVQSRTQGLPICWRADDQEVRGRGKFRPLYSAAVFAALVTAAAPVLSLMLLPSDMDAMAAWVSLFSFKATLALALGLLWLYYRRAQGQGQGQGLGQGQPSLQRLIMAACCAYGGACLEAALLFAPTLHLGWYWVNERLMHPVCLQGKWLQRHFGCTVVAFVLMLGPPVVLSLVSLCATYSILFLRQETASARAAVKDV